MMGAPLLDSASDDAPPEKPVRRSRSLDWEIVHGVFFDLVDSIRKQTGPLATRVKAYWQGAHIRFRRDNFE